jgi:hypothetical protein
MKIYKKQGNQLVSLGEGKMFSKSQLRLKEGVNAALPISSNVQDALRKAREISMQNPNVTAVSGDAGKMDGRNDVRQGEGVKISVPMNASTTQLNHVNDIAKDPNNNDATIEFTKPTTNGGQASSTNESLDYLRENSVPFTKNELIDLFQSMQ